jgi:hypothetical protein
MTLDQLEWTVNTTGFWEQANVGDYELYRRVRTSSEERWPTGNYQIVGPDRPFSEDLDPIVAQCILYHILDTQKVTP